MKRPAAALTAVFLACLVLLSLVALTGCGQPPADATPPQDTDGHPAAADTEVLGVLVGPGATLHPDNVAPHPIEYYGTDLGFTYEHRGRLELLFGDTMANEAGDPIEPSSGRRFEDSFGSVDLDRWQDPATISAGNLPLVRLGQNRDSTAAAAIDPGHALEGFKTPVGGFSNGSDEFGVFFTYKPQGCRVDADCSNGARCDTGLGYLGPSWSSDEGLTFGCVDGSSSGCTATTIPESADSGLCNDRSSTIFAEKPMGRIGSLTIKLLIGRRDSAERKRYATDHVWQTNKFMNISLRTVRAFTPDDATTRYDFRPADSAGGDERVFIWGRPHFVGVNAAGRGVGLYFAYVDLPAGEDYAWRPRYFASVDAGGQPRFSDDEADAAAIDLDATVDGVQPSDRHDVVDQVSIAWVPQLEKWLMFYGGGMSNLPLPPVLPRCGVLEIFTGPECSDVVIGNGAFRMRTADYPWGPWSPPSDLVAAGDPEHPEDQYGPGGMLYHPACDAADCAPLTGSTDRDPRDYGFFYGANIIEQWFAPAGDGVDVIWNASTWNPYRVILLRTRINP